MQRIFFTAVFALHLAMQGLAQDDCIPASENPRAFHALWSDSGLIYLQTDSTRFEVQLTNQREDWWYIVEEERDSFMLSHLDDGRKYTYLKQNAYQREWAKVFIRLMETGVFPVSMFYGPGDSLALETYRRRYEDYAMDCPLECYVRSAYVGDVHVLDSDRPDFKLFIFRVHPSLIHVEGDQYYGIFIQIKDDGTVEIDCLRQLGIEI